jgi:hypothetical protein
MAEIEQYRQDQANKDSQAFTYALSAPRPAADYDFSTRYESLEDSIQQSVLVEQTTDLAALVQTLACKLQRRPRRNDGFEVTVQINMCTTHNKVRRSSLAERLRLKVIKISKGALTVAAHALPDHSPSLNPQHPSTLARLKLTLFTESFSFQTPSALATELRR